MKFLIISDIHGALPPLKQVLAAAADFPADGIILLGDLLNHGARNKLPEGYAPAAVVECLNPLAHKIICVRGNCDGDVDGMLFNFPCNAPYSCLMVPEYMDHKIFITHGHLYDFKTPEGAAKLGLQPGDIVLSGHTHLAGVKKCESGVINVNPGSISLPRSGQSGSFAYLDEQGFRIVTLTGELTAEYPFS